ncbi:phage holin family protein [Candidatus Peregrinibacteria bacterium]|nr:MAG: phage holin family protein [Candidatus Peregrinibacteria bacterium]
MTGYIFSPMLRRFLRKIGIAILSNSLAVWLAAEIVPQYFHIESSPVWMGFVFVGIVVALLNTFVKPFLKLLSLPFVFFTLGLFLLIINMIILLLVQWVFQEMSSSIMVNIEGGFGGYFLASVVLTLTNSVFRWVLRPPRK